MKLAKTISALVVFLFVAGAAQAQTRTPQQSDSLPDFSKVAGRALHSVVAIEVAGKKPDSRQLPEDHPPIPKRFQKAEGSGFVVDALGLVLTNEHVVSGASEITVTFNSNQRYKATVVNTDREADVALLKIEPRQPLRALRLANSSRVKVGQWVIAIGNPMGTGSNVSVGVIGGKDRRLPDSEVSYLQSDAAVSPGSSGGPILDRRGRVVGMTTALLPDSRMGLSIPSNVLKEKLREFGQ